MWQVGGFGEPSRKPDRWLLKTINLTSRYGAKGACGEYPPQPQ